MWLVLRQISFEILIRIVIVQWKWRTDQIGMGLGTGNIEQQKTNLRSVKVCIYEINQSQGTNLWLVCLYGLRFVHFCVSVYKIIYIFQTNRRGDRRHSWLVYAMRQFNGIQHKAAHCKCVAAKKGPWKLNGTLRVCFRKLFETICIHYEVYMVLAWFLHIFFFVFFLYICMCCTFKLKLEANLMSY